MPSEPPIRNATGLAASRQRANRWASSGLVHALPSRVRATARASGGTFAPSRLASSARRSVTEREWVPSLTSASVAFA